MKQTVKLTLKLFRQDIRYQIVKRWYYFLMIVPLILYMCFDMNKKIQGITYTLGSCMAYIFKGTLEYVKDVHPFEVLPEFMLIHMVLAYMVSYYPVRDLHQRGSLIFIRTEKASAWWYAKCLWLWTMVTIYYGTILMTVLLYSRNGSFIPDSLFMSMEFGMEPGGSQLFYFIYLMLIPYMTSLMLSMIQMLIGIMTSPIYGFMTIVFIQLISNFYYSQWLPGNFLMVNRMAIGRSDGIACEIPLLVGVGVLTVCIVTGKIYIQKKDVF